MLKLPPESENELYDSDVLELIETEKYIYQRLGHHRQICTYNVRSLLGIL
jgi:hypothetical protein